MEAVISFFRILFKYRTKLVDQIMFYLSMICALAVVVHIGYITDKEVAEISERFVIGAIYLLFVIEGLRTVAGILTQRKVNVADISGLVLIGYFVVIGLSRSEEHTSEL